MIGRPLELINYLYEQDKDEQFEISPLRDNRSKNQNSLAWKLIVLIANIVGKSKEEVYFQMLKDYGQSMLIPVPKGQKPIFKYYEYKESSILNGKPADWYLIMKGSSEFNTKEMSIFIDGIIQEAEQLDIYIDCGEKNE